MKSALEEIARDALGLNPPPPAPKRAHAASAQKTVKPRRRSRLHRFFDEQFRVFELAYGSGATLVLIGPHRRATGPAEVCHPHRPA